MTIHEDRTEDCPDLCLYMCQVLRHPKENNKGLITLMTVFKDAPIDQHSRNWPVFISAKSFRKTILIRHLKHHQPAQHVQPNQVGVLFFLNVALLELCERLFCLAGHVVDEEKK